MLPEALFTLTRGFQASRILLTAVELNVFSALTPDGATAEDVAGRLGCDPEATARLLNALTALKLLTKDHGVFRNTPDTARYLTDSSPESEWLATMHSVNLWDYWSGLTDYVRAGVSAPRREEQPRDVPWVDSFMAAMEHIGGYRAPYLVRAVGAESVRRLLDVGGGPATYSIALARAHPALRAEVLDLPGVIPITRRHIEAAGLADRIGTIEGDLTTCEFGTGYDMVLVSNICHMLSPEQNRDLLSRCAKALAADGRIVIQDFILNEDRAGPPAAALFAINMLVATESGSSYTEQEYARWLEEAGFSGVHRAELPGPTDMILADKLPAGG